MNLPITLNGFNSQVSTMSSREIAVLCDKRHAHVLRDIERMLQDIAEPKFGLSDFLSVYTDATGRSLKEYRLPKDLTLTLVAGYRADLRFRVIKRLEELEVKAHTPALDLNDPMQLRGLLSNYVERTQVAEERVALLAPKAEAYDQLDAVEGALSLRPAAKVLGVKEKKLATWLQVNHWAFRQSGHGPLQAYSAKRDVGYLDHKLTDYFTQDGEKRASITLMFTPKGLKRLADIKACSGL